MSEEANPTPVQQANPPAGQQAPGNPAPVQQAAPPQPPEGHVPHERFAGLQRTLEGQVLRNRELEGQVAQQSQYQATLEDQLRSLQDQMNQQAQQLNQFQQSAAQAQQQNQFWTLLSRDYPDLVPLAETFRVVDDEAAQRQVFDLARERIGGAIQRQAAQQVASTLQGTAPGAPATTLNAPRVEPPTYAEVMAHVMDDDLARDDPKEWERWYQIYQNHPEMTYESLGLGSFVDPTPNHYQTRAQHVAQQTGQPAPQQAPQSPNSPSPAIPVPRELPGIFNTGGGQG